MVITSVDQQQAMDLFYEVHLGASQMKGLAYVYEWWPRIDSDLEW